MNKIFDPPEHPTAPEPYSNGRFTLISGKQMKNLPDMEWLVEGLIPAKGAMALIGQSGVGKSFLAWDLAIAAASGASWCGYKLSPAIDSVYVGLEGRAGYKGRGSALELRNGRELPERFKLIFDDLSLGREEGSATIV